MAERYSISQDDFSRKFDEIPQDYKLGDKVTRENFTSFLIYSFRKSRGLPDAHGAILEWILENNGFNYTISFRNFIDAGAWRALSQTEQDLFVEKFRHVEVHTERSVNLSEVTMRDQLKFLSKSQTEIFMSTSGDWRKKEWNDFLEDLNKKIEYEKEAWGRGGDLYY